MVRTDGGADDHVQRLDRCTAHLQGLLRCPAGHLRRRLRRADVAFSSCRPGCAIHSSDVSTIPDISSFVTTRDGTK